MGFVLFCFVTGCVVYGEELNFGLWLRASEGSCIILPAPKVLSAPTFEKPWVYPLHFQLFKSWLLVSCGPQA